MRGNGGGLEGEYKIKQRQNNKTKQSKWIALRRVKVETSRSIIIAALLSVVLCGNTCKSF